MKIIVGVLLSGVLMSTALGSDTLAPTAAHPHSRSPTAVFNDYVAAFNRHDTDALDPLLTPESLHKDIASDFYGKGPAQIKEFVREILKSQPELRWHATTLVESGSVVAAEWTWTSHYTGDGPNGPVKSKLVSARGATIAVIENRKVKRFTDYFDFASAIAASSSTQ